MIRLAAFDLSLTSTGYATNTDPSPFGPVIAGTLTPPKRHDRGVARLRWIRDEALRIADDADVVVVEGYSFSSKFSPAHSLGELGGVVRVALTERGLTWVEVPPASVKLFAAGKGNAGKEEMLAAAIRRLEYAGHSNDEADALWLLSMASAHYGQGATNDHGRRALAKVDWPTIPNSLKDQAR